ncbi:hypothetical protein [Pseudomonas sp. SG20052]|nr:hypothetical protein [Pseudomonas sp. SG20052]WNF58518.1 hypothetical protein RHP74_14875 [Pseudomonas sp. SG20052]
MFSLTIDLTSLRLIGFDGFDGFDRGSASSLGEVYADDLDAFNVRKP